MPRRPSDDTTCTGCCKPPVHHVHRRDWRPCPTTMPARLRPTKAVSIWLYRWADAVQHHETMVEFVAAHPADFPELAS